MTEKRLSNREYATDATFKELCEKAEVKATKRQASKYRLQKGKAFQFQRQHPPVV